MNLERTEVPECLNFFIELHSEVDKIPINDFSLDSDQTVSRTEKIRRLIDKKIKPLSAEKQIRIENEIYNYGPLNSLFADEDITEILVNGRTSIWYEKNGYLFQHKDIFYTALSFRNVIDRICQVSKSQLTVERPYVDGSFNSFRLALVGPALTGDEVNLSFRRHPHNPWNFSKLVECGWCSEREKDLLVSLLKTKNNLLIVGATSSGKTSVLNSFLGCMEPSERVIIIEDTLELTVPNLASLRLLTREDSQGILPSVDQGQLVKCALRLRPDRIVMGEMRGVEAKDFLQALATGHQGSFGTLHANDPRQALIRLEMLIQMGAPQWNLQAIRRLVQLSLNYIVMTGRENGKRKFQGIFKLTSLEENGFLIEKIEI